MQLEIMTLPWQQYKKFYEEGKLQDRKFINTEESANFYDQNAVYFSEIAGDSYILHYGVYLDSNRFHDVEFNCKKHFITFCSLLLNDEYETDLGEAYEIEGVEGILSAERVKAMAETASKIDLEEIRKVFIEISNPVAEGHDPSSEQNEIMDWLLNDKPMKLIHPLQTGVDEFVDYIRMLITFITKASEEDRCVVIELR